MYKPPVFGEIRFSCPHCGALAHQYWAQLRYRENTKDKSPSHLETDKILKLIENNKNAKATEKLDDDIFDQMLSASKGAVLVYGFREDPYSYEVSNLHASRCDSCSEISVWLQEKLVYPATGPAGMANPDMPEKVRALFDEASTVFQTSPRAAAALLRLALQHLLKELGEEGKSIDKDINRLIDKGLSADLSKVFHSVRIIGNESVHPGEINVDDEPYMAEVMFGLLNQIVDQMISIPARNEALWEKMPENKRKPVEHKLTKRDKP